MTSKDDDAMPLPGFSQELTPDVTVDEDFIPTSQPQSIVSSKMSRNSDASFNKSSEELTSSHAASLSRIDDTLPHEAIIDHSTFENNKSADFIPDTETKRTNIGHANEDMSCKKKLAVFGPEDAFGIRLNPTWDGDVSRIPESPALDTQNFSTMKESPFEVAPSNQKIVKRNEESITEIIVNDSAETVDLEVTPMKIKKSESGENLESYSSSDMERCEETQIFDNSSVLLLDQPGPSGLGLENIEKISEAMGKSYLRAAVDDNKENSQDRANGSDLQGFCSTALITDEFSRKPDSVKREALSSTKLHQNEVQSKSSYSEPSSTSVAVRKMDFKVIVSCLVSVNTKTNKILHKTILNVKETLKTKHKATIIDQPSESTSEKSKRQSTSSSGSVYSDKTGLPFALNKRISIISDQTDSSEDDFSVHVKRGKRIHERTPWSNEYLFPLAMDDIIQDAIENEEFLKRSVLASPRKSKGRPGTGVNQLKEILEGSSSRTSLGDSAIGEPPKANNTEERIETLKNSVPEVEKLHESIKNNVQNEKDINVGSENMQFDAQQEQPSSEPEPEPEIELKRQTVEQKRIEEETTSVSLSDGLPVFARWTDKRYYSGVLSGDVKNDRWDVKFDDGTSKTVREDLIMPADWLKVGALVFALIDDKYESGQITDIKRGKEVDYIVELDVEKKEISVKISDLCLTDVMAGIVREKYRPLSGTPRGRADIDFDNVVCGKRLREQKTPLKPLVTVGAGGSGLKKKSSKAKKSEGQSLQSVKETPQKKGSELKMRGLKSDGNGHLVEDKVISADSHSGNETGETPLRKTSREPKGKAKPRSLSYDTESGKGKTLVASDGTSVPGPSGVKSKRQKTRPEVEEPENSFTEEGPESNKSSKKSPAKAPQSSEKSKRKRKMDESVEESLQKKSLKEGNRMKTKNRKG